MRSYSAIWKPENVVVRNKLLKSLQLFCIHSQDLIEFLANGNIAAPEYVGALDRLSEFDLVRRKTDPLDRRSVLVQRTVAGAVFLRDLKKILTDAGKVAETVPSKARRAGALVGTA